MSIRRQLVFSALGALVLMLCSMAATVTVAHADDMPNLNPWAFDMNNPMMLSDYTDIADAINSWVAGGKLGGTGLNMKEYIATHVDGFAQGDLDNLDAVIQDLGACLDWGNCGKVSQEDAQAAYNSINEALHSTTPTETATDAVQYDAWQYVRGEVPPISPEVVGSDFASSPAADAWAADMWSAESDMGMLTTVADTASSVAEGASVVEMASALNPIVATGTVVIMAFQLSDGYFMRWAVPMPEVPTDADITQASISTVPKTSTSHGLGYVIIPHYDDGTWSYIPQGGEIANESQCPGFSPTHWPYCIPYLQGSGSPSTSDMDKVASELWTWFGDSASIPHSYGDPYGGDVCEGVVDCYRRMIPASGVGSPADGVSPTLEPPSWTPDGTVTPFDGSQNSPVGDNWNNATAPSDVIAHVPDGLKPYIDHSIDPQYTVDPITGAHTYIGPGTGTDPGTGTGGATWTVPDCTNVMLMDCEASISEVAPPGVTYVEHYAPDYVPTVTPGAVVATDPLAGAETDLTKIYIEVNPEPDTVTIPDIQPDETYDTYIATLTTLGLIGTITWLDLTTGNPQCGPGCVVRTNPPPGQRVRVGTPVQVFGNPLDWPYPNGGGTTTPPPPPNVTPPPPGPPPVGPPPGNNGCNCPPIDFAPLENINVGSAFPFGVFTWIADFTGGLGGTSGGAVTLTFEKPSAMGGGTFTQELSSTTWETYRPTIFLILDFLMTFAGVWLLCFRLIGIGGGSAE